MSITNIVLVFSKLPSFVRKILHREENKGVEFTGGRERKTRRQKLECRNGDGEGESSSSEFLAFSGRESGKRQKKRQLPRPCTNRKNGAPPEKKYKIKSPSHPLNIEPMEWSLSLIHI